MSPNPLAEQRDDVPPGPAAEASEGDWLAWRAVIAPPPDPSKAYDPWVRHKIMFVGHNIAATAWHERRRARRLYRQEGAEQGRLPDEHAALVIYLHCLFHGICLTCPWAGPGRVDRSSALVDATDHQRSAATDVTEARS